MKNKAEHKAQLKSILQKQDVANYESALTRARSVTVGTAFGGVTEINMRSAEGYVVWSPLQPVEVIELIHQLAANVGCHIHLQPRNDFASWRDWRITEEDKQHLNGHTPFVNDMAPHNHVGANLPAPEQQPGLQPALMAKEKQDEQTVAVKKIVGRKRTKRTPTPA